MNNCFWGKKELNRVVEFSQVRNVEPRKLKLNLNKGQECIAYFERRLQFLVGFQLKAESSTFSLQHSTAVNAITYTKFILWVYLRAFAIDMQQKGSNQHCSRALIGI